MREIKKFARPIQVVLLFAMPALLATIVVLVLTVACSMLSPSTITEILYSNAMYVLDLVIYVIMLIVVGDYMWSGND